VSTQPPAGSSTSRLSVFKCTDAGNGDLLASLYKNCLRFDHSQKCWLIFRKHWWVEDVDGRVFRMAKKATQIRYKRALRLPEDLRKLEAKWAIESESLYRLKAALSCAENTYCLADAGHDWNSDPWLFGVGNGVLDLRTGTLRDGTPEDRITLHSDLDFDPDAKCPVLEESISKIFSGSCELVDYIQRAIGYSLTGLTSEQCIFLCSGSGSNGKTTLLEALRHIFGQYAVDTPFSTFELQGRSAISNDIAALVGRRFVTASETNEGVRLNEARVKALTGGEVIPARFLYREYFNFRPAAKFWLAFNHEPVIADDSHGMWRRIVVIPFLRRFEEADQDKELGKKLFAEAQGILAWAVRGCLRWQELGLGKPNEVKNATREYREESDTIGPFIAEYCVERPEARETSAALYLAYTGWASFNDEKTLDRSTFSRRIKARGHLRVKIGHASARGWEGICLKNRSDSGMSQSKADVRTDTDTSSPLSTIGKHLV
jgi:putative DNA primase/helicase